MSSIIGAEDLPRAKLLGTACADSLTMTICIRVWHLSRVAVWLAAGGWGAQALGCTKMVPILVWEGGTLVGRSGKRGACCKPLMRGDPSRSCPPLLVSFLGVVCCLACWLCAG